MTRLIDGVDMTEPCLTDAHDLVSAARRVRALTMRMIESAGKGHPGSSLSIVELLVVHYYRVLRWSPDRLDDPERDRLVLSKGHGAPALYAVLIDVGVLDSVHVHSLRLIDSPLQGHPDPRFTPGVEFPTGSLGQGFSAAVGMALGLKRSGSRARVYVIVGDGECQEGQVWEAANLAAAERLDNLTVVVDNNRLQHDSATATMVGAPDLAPRWTAFGWDTANVDGHDLEALEEALRTVSDGRPRALIAQTIKGKGVVFMENQVEWHSVADPTQLRHASALLEGASAGEES